MKVTSISSHKSGNYPFWSENIVPGQRVLVKSAAHRKELMKQHGLVDANDFSGDYIKKRQRWAKEEKNKERKKELEKIFSDAKYERIDMRKERLRQRKAEYEMRNYGRVL